MIDICAIKPEVVRLPHTACSLQAHNQHFKPTPRSKDWWLLVRCSSERVVAVRTQRLQGRGKRLGVQLELAALSKHRSSCWLTATPTKSGC